MQTLFAIAAIAALFSALAALAEHLRFSSYEIPVTLQSLLMADNMTNLTSYPTDITRDIVPKSLHSHNDYWREVPFWSALSVGAISIEADVWLYNDTLYVGHEEGALTEARTFQSLYVQPILAVLQRQNPSGPFVTSPTKNGVFDQNSAQTLYLWIDVKTPGEETWPHVIEELEPLRSADYLTKVVDSTVTAGPVTVIGSGNTPLNQVQGISPRDYFYDAPLSLLNSTFSNITSTVCPIASTNFLENFGPVRSGVLSLPQQSKLESQIAMASAKGIGARYWDTPAFPASTRNMIWRTLWNAGVTLINVDDLVGAAAILGGVTETTNLAQALSR